MLKYDGFLFTVIRHVLLKILYICFICDFNLFNILKKHTTMDKTIARILQISPIYSIQLIQTTYNTYNRKLLTYEHHITITKHFPSSNMLFIHMFTNIYTKRPTKHIRSVNQIHHLNHSNRWRLCTAENTYVILI